MGHTGSDRTPTRKIEAGDDRHDGPDERVARLVHAQIYQQARRRPHDLALYCPDGNVSYDELCIEIDAWAAHLLRSGLTSPDCVLPVYMASSSIWAVVAICAVLRAGTAFVFVDSSSPGATIRLQSVARTLNSRCIITGGRECEASQAGLVALHTVCIAGKAPPPKIYVIPSHRAMYTQSLAWGFVEDVDRSISFHRHDAICASMGLLEPVLPECSLKNQSHVGTQEAPPRVLLAASMAYHETLLQLFDTLRRGGTIFMVARDSTGQRPMLRDHLSSVSKAFVSREALSGEVDFVALSALKRLLTARWTSDEYLCIPHTIWTTATVVEILHLGYGAVVAVQVFPTGDTQVISTQHRALAECPGHMGSKMPAKTFRNTKIPCSASTVIRMLPLPDLQPAQNGMRGSGILPNGLVQLATEFKKGNDVEQSLLQENCHFQNSEAVSRKARESPVESGPLKHTELVGHSSEVPGIVDKRLETTLKGIWYNVLGIQHGTLSQQDRFLDCGGDSLKGARLLSLAQAAGIQIPAHQVFVGNPSLEEMVSSINTMVSQPNLSGTPCGEGISSLNESAPAKAEKSDLSQWLHLSLQDWIKTEHIENIVQTTGWQASLLGYSTLEAQHWTDCWSIDLYGSLSADCLQYSCSQLLRHCEILRTIFAVTNGQALQVIIGPDHYPLEFALHQVRNDQGETLKSLTETLWCSSRSELSAMDDQVVRFMLIRQDDRRHRLLVRVRHAQYDAGSIPTVLELLSDAYQARLHGEIFHPRSAEQFSSFIRWVTRSEYTKSSEAFWMNRLADSKPTQLLPLSPPPMSTGYTINKKIKSAEIILKRQVLQGLTIASITSAAWSAVLAHVVGDKDVVHGIVTSGRHAEMVGLDRVVGPCWNVLPVRARMHMETQTVRAFVQQVQTDQQTSLAHESLGFRRIVERCTSWPAWTNLCSVINFENVAIPRTGAARHAIAPDLECEFTPMPGPVAGTDIWVAVTPFLRSGRDYLTVELRFDENRYSIAYMEFILNLFCHTVVSFCEEADSLLSVVLGKVQTKTSCKLPHPYGNHQTRSHVSRVSNLVRDVWNQVLGTSACVDTPCDIPYYTVYGEITFAAGLAQCLSRRLHVRVSTEDVINHPSLESLQLWIVRKFGTRLFTAALEESRIGTPK